MNLVLATGAVGATILIMFIDAIGVTYLEHTKCRHVALLVELLLSNFGIMFTYASTAVVTMLNGKVVHTHLSPLAKPPIREV